MRVRGAILSVVLVACGCLAPPGAQRGHALYPAATPRLPLDQVARLSVVVQVESPQIGATAVIKSVDGREVGSVGTAFELLPGCHVVEVEHRPYYRSLRPGGADFRGQLGTHVFPFRMRAGHEYVVVLRFDPTTVMLAGVTAGALARVSAHGVETDRRGTQVQTIAAATSPRDVQACDASTTPPG